MKGLTFAAMYLSLSEILQENNTVVPITKKMKNYESFKLKKVSHFGLTLKSEAFALIQS